MSLRALGPIAGILAATLVTGCAETIVAPSASSTAEPTTIATVELEGSRAELLAQLDAELQALSGRIIERDAETAALERIEAVWAALRTELEGERPELVPGFESVVDLARNAVTRRRPADADKARLNAGALLDAAG